jgi:hypothetical protein
MNRDAFAKILLSGTKLEKKNKSKRLLVLFSITEIHGITSLCLYPSVARSLHIDRIYVFPVLEDGSAVSQGHSIAMFKTAVTMYRTGRTLLFLLLAKVSTGFLDYLVPKLHETIIPDPLQRRLNKERKKLQP